MSDTVEPVGTYWDLETWNQARSAYLSDLDRDPQCPDAFIGWLHRSLEAHAHLSSTERSELGIELPARRKSGQGLSRTYPIEISLLAKVDDAIVEDRRKLDRVIGRSGFVHEAAVVAIAAARARRGSELPPPPRRLPTRPRRGVVPLAASSDA